MCPIKPYILVAQTWPKRPHSWLLFLSTGYKRAVLRTTILSNGRGHFGPTYQGKWTGQSGTPSKLVPSIPIGPNRYFLFHLMYQHTIEPSQHGKRLSLIILKCDFYVVLNSFIAKLGCKQLFFSNKCYDNVPHNRLKDMNLFCSNHILPIPLKYNQWHLTWVTLSWFFPSLLPVLLSNNFLSAVDPILQPTLKERKEVRP